MVKTIIYNHFTTQIVADSAVEVDAGDLKFDNRTGKILGVMLHSSRLDQLWLRGSFRMTISGIEIFPIRTPSKMFVVNSSAALKDRFYMFNDSKGNPAPVESGDLTLALKLLSTNNALQAFAAYDFTFSFMIETKE